MPNYRKKSSRTVNRTWKEKHKHLVKISNSILSVLALCYVTLDFYNKRFEMNDVTGKHLLI